VGSVGRTIIQIGDNTSSEESGGEDHIFGLNGRDFLDGGPGKDGAVNCEHLVTIP
jgi:hypothetical protein